VIKNRGFNFKNFGIRKNIRVLVYLIKSNQEPKFQKNQKAKNLHRKQRRIEK
jgi:hypothetical protein